MPLDSLARPISGINKSSYRGAAEEIRLNDEDMDTL